MRQQAIEEGALAEGLRSILIHMDRNTAAFYHDPPMWFGSSPAGFADVNQTPDFDSFRTAVVQRNLGNGIEVKVTTEGLIGFNFAAWEPGILPEESDLTEGGFEQQAQRIVRRTQVMNSFLAFLYTNGHAIHQRAYHRMVVTPELVIPMQGLDNQGMSFGNSTVAHLAMSSFPSTYPVGTPPLFDNRLLTRGEPIPVEVIDRTVSDLDDLMTRHPEDGIVLLDLFLRATKAHQDHNHNAAVIGYWAVCEKLVNELWQQYLADNRERDGEVFISRKRKETLDDGRSFTASVMIEMLSFASRIDFDLYNKLSQVRKARNGWMHALKDITVDDARTAGKASEELLKQVRGVTVSSVTPLRTHG